MGHLSGTLRLDAPPERVWQFLADASLRPRWEIGVIAVEEVTGPLDQLGATWTEVRKLNGITMREHFRVTEVEPQRLLQFSGTSAGGGRTTIRERLVANEDGGTLKSFEADYTLPGGPLGALIDRLFLHRKLERDSHRVNQQIRAIVDSD